MEYQCAITLDSPLGMILVQGSKSHIQYLKFADAEDQTAALNPGSEYNDAEWFRDCTDQLQRYFAGKLQQFNLPIQPKGTEFQKQVWQALCDVKLGCVDSYQHLAANIGNVKAVRAVANANARNPIWLLIPCHRIVGSDNALRGYAGGIERKAKLLQLEGRMLDCAVLDGIISAEINEKTKVFN
jgi:methylated-DNA-[protein]-cysteine S-methyltransferase